MTAVLISEQDEFDALCEHIRTCGLVAFDTEFVSEYHFRPKLCLLQFATIDQCVAVDPMQGLDLSNWWKLMADEETTVIVHGGREEVRYCVHFHNAPPRQLIDVQIAQGLLSRGYPLSYRALVNTVTGQRVQGNETRTDWRRRPLSDKQIDYALEDVRHLIGIWKTQLAQLQDQQRTAWATAEIERMIEEVHGEQPLERWRKLSGIARLSVRQLAVARALYAWRYHKAESLDRPMRSVFRDDLLVEVAQRQPDTPKDLLETRGMQRREYQKLANEMVEVVQQVKQLPEGELPKRVKNRKSNAQDDVLGRLLGLALSNRCAELSVSMQLVGTTSDIQDLIRHHVHGEACDTESGLPRLMTGWRQEVCGDLLTRLLDGKVSARVGNPKADDPLVFEVVE